MYKNRDDHPRFVDFLLPFDGKLDPGNRWVRLAEMIPWDALEGLYSAKFSKGTGRPGKNVRIALGAQIIKHRLNLTDEEVVEQVSENPYLQYFIGMEEFRTEAPFDSSSLARFRDRFSLDDISKIMDMVEESAESKIRKPPPPGDGRGAGGGGEGSGSGKTDGPERSGKLLVDATVAPADIKYPTDIGLLNDAREKTEALVDKLWEGTSKEGRKPRTYRRVARRAYLKVSKKRRLGKKLLRRGIRFQLNCLERNLGHIDRLLPLSAYALTDREWGLLAVARELAFQQRTMLENGERRVPDRIVSVSQPHVRPIVRGKASAPVEFGAKISVSLVDGIARIHRLSWDAFNEGGDLLAQVEEYKGRYGFYPESVHADKIYSTRENRRRLKELGIRFSGPPLGRPPKDEATAREKRSVAKRDAIDRIPIEGKFGQGKRKYGLDLIMAKLKNTSEVWIAMIILVMNLEKWLERVVSSFFRRVFDACFRKKEDGLFGNSVFSWKAFFVKIVFQ